MFDHSTTKFIATKPQTHPSITKYAPTTPLYTHLKIFNKCDTKTYAIEFFSGSIKTYENGALSNKNLLIYFSPFCLEKKVQLFFMNYVFCKTLFSSQ